MATIQELLLCCIALIQKKIDKLIKSKKYFYNFEPYEIIKEFLI